MKTKTFHVEDKHAASAIASGALHVLGTPALVGFLENLAFEDSQELCEEGKTTVGSAMNMNHLAPTKIGEDVEIRLLSRIVDGKKISYELEAVEGDKQIATAHHVRFIVDAARFMGNL